MTKMLSVGSLFSGIGGFDLGLERTGHFKIEWQCEIDPFCNMVLEKHWPNVDRYLDVRSIPGSAIPVDLLCGGFPCQPVSSANPNRRGSADERWLWPNFLECIQQLGPKYVLVENVRGLLQGGLDEVLGSLAGIGYDTEWDCISASALGAPHVRDRVFLVAYPSSVGRQWRSIFNEVARQVEAMRRSEGSGRAWAAESRPVGVAYGIPRRVDRLRALGNSVVPLAIEMIGQAIWSDYEREYL